MSEALEKYECLLAFWAGSYKVLKMASYIEQNDWNALNIVD